MKLNYRDPIWALALIACLFLAMWNCEGKKRAELESQAANTDVLRLEAEKRHYIDVDSRRIDSARVVRVSDSLEVSKKLSALKASADFWKSEATKRRPQVNVLADSVPILREFLEATDSIIQKQDSIIDVQRGHAMVQSKLYQFEIAQMADKQIKTQELADVWKDEAYRQEKRGNREERRKRFWRTTTLIAGSVAVVLGLTTLAQ